MTLELSRENRQVTAIDVTEAQKTLTTKATEYSYTIPEKTKQILFHLQSLSYDLKYSFTSLGPYRKVPAGSSRELTKVLLESKTLYFMCDDADGEIVELEIWI